MKLGIAKLDTRAERIMKTALTAMAMAVAFTGCKASDFMSTVGQYQGILTEKSSTQSAQTMVTGSIASPGYLALDVKVSTAEDAPRNWEFKVTASRSGQVTLFDSSDNSSIALKPAAGNCYMNSNAADFADAATRLCYEGNQVTLDITPSGSPTSLSFIINKATADTTVKLEDPADYTLSQLRTRAITRSFNSEIEFENVVQAHLNAQAAHLALAPSINFGSVMTALSSFGMNIATDMLALVRMAGSLTPFLIPSNWFLAKEATFQSDAERYGYLLMQADSGNIAASLAYDVARDTESITTMQAERVKIASLRGEVYERERLGLMPHGSTNGVDSVINACDQTILALQTTIAGEYISLSQSVGFINPHAVRSVKIDNPSSVTNPETFDEPTAEQMAIIQASELTQMKYLISAAETTKTERYFDWINPSGGTGPASIGFGMGTYIAIAASQVRQLEDKEVQLESTVVATVSTNNTGLTSAIAGYQLALRNIVIQDDLVNNLLKNMRSGLAVAVTDLMTAYAGQMQAQLNKVNTEYQYLAALENMQRSLYVGPYHGLGNDSSNQPAASHK